ncbi:MAG: BMP family ABC transporter substrate-binding protein [Holophaga sp.]|nr:BMP family ABC transporter substrate-binding protein [Holophaga sp.]
MHPKPLLHSILGGAALLAGAALIGAAPEAKVGFVYVGPVGDAGWTYQHDLGRRQLEKHFKGKVATQFVENVPEGADSERVIREMAKAGCKVVFTTSFGYMNPTLTVARAYPTVTFLQAAGTRTAANVGSYNGRFYEGRYLNGVIAGRMTRSNVAGIVAAFPTPEVVMGINAFARGMRSVNPRATVKVVWINAWFDSGKEREAALALIAQGADMLTHDTDSTAVVQTAEERGVASFCYNSDEAKYGPHSQLCGTIQLWGDFYARTVEEVLAGSWKPETTWGGFSQGMIALAPMSPAVPKPVQALVQKLRKQISAGKLHPFTGPIVDQAGRLRVPAGRTITDAELNKMDYFVPGVDSVMPNS